MVQETCFSNNSTHTRKMNKCLYIFAIYLTLSMLDGFVHFPFVLIQLTQYIFIGCGILKALICNRLNISLYATWGVLFLLCMLGSCLYCPDTSVAIQYSILPYIVTFGVYWSLFVFTDTEEGMNHIINIYCFAGTVFSIICFIFYSHDLFSGHRFGYSVGLNPNEVMFNLMIPTCFCFYRAFCKNKVDKKYFLLFIMCLLVSLCTGSKKTIVIVAFAVVFLLIKAGKNKIRTILFLLLLLIVGCWAVFNVDFLYDALGSRIDNWIYAETVGFESTQTDMVRFGMREKAFMMFLEKPLFGHGCEAFRVLSGYGTYSHNNYVEILSSYGIIGFALYYWLPVYMLVRSGYHVLTTRNIVSCLIFSLICVYLVLDYGAVTTYAHFNMGLFAIIVVLYKNAESQIAELKSKRME